MQLCLCVAWEADSCILTQTNHGRTGGTATASAKSPQPLNYPWQFQGTRNMLTFVVALALAVSGAVLVGLSKEVHL
ncbi:hypothetical protein Y032_0071g552 [Ancylostoma ceylanicum]|uniref:Uncharacterized protein n=1 Tax=Ancylostoma ceylanicum TaxID=53326 RepID=A0A016TY17_9BILA|nr:hypothetical protein Y032_0071g552 [Ancylostoma ceylanicum]